MAALPYELRGNRITTELIESDAAVTSRWSCCEKDLKVTCAETEENKILTAILGRLLDLESPSE